MLLWEEWLLRNKPLFMTSILILVYSSTGTLYDMIPHAPRSSKIPNPTPHVESHAANGVIGSINQETKSNTSTTTFNPKTTPTTMTTLNTTPPATPSSNTYEVNVVQSTPTAKTRNNKKGKGKTKQTSQPQVKMKTPPAEDKEKRKPKYPCLICDEDHYTKYFSCHVDVNCFLKGTSITPVVLTNPFPYQKTQMVTSEQRSVLGSSYVLMCKTDKYKEASLTT
jgi:type IV secretory pathway VirB10-like protein